MSSWRGEQSLFCWVPSRSTDSAAPPTSLLALRVSGWAWGPRPGAGAGRLWDASRRSWQLKRGEAAWQQQQTAGGGGRRAGSTSTRVAQGSSGGRASERARSSPGRKRTFHTLAWRDLQPARCNGGGLCAAPTLEPRSLKMISTSKIFPNCCRDRERMGWKTGERGYDSVALPIHSLDVTRLR